MKKTILFIGIGVVLATSTMLLANSCKKEAGPSTPEVLKAYIEENMEQKVPEYKDYSAYFDLSDGLLSAYANPNIKGSLEKIINKVTSNDKCEAIYGMKDGKITTLDMKPTALYNYIMDKRTYQRTAPIEETLRQIVGGDQGAFLITDYEEYNGGRIQHQNYAKPYFKQWIEKGNSIEFFVYDYTEGKTDKHLYFTVFDSPDGALTQDIHNALGTLSSDEYEVFRMGNDPYTVETAYQWTKFGGHYRDAKGWDVVSQTVLDGEDKYTFYEGYNAEFYPFEEPWEYIVKNVKELKGSDPDDLGDDPMYENFLQGITIKFDGMDGYKIEDVDVNVTNINADFEAFYDYYEASKDPEAEAVAYKAVKGKKIKDMFEFTGSDEDEIEGNVINVAIDFDEHFTGKNELGKGDMIRVDIVLGDCELAKARINRLFAWGDNNSLRDAIESTLQDCNPEGRILYTYYLQCQ